MKWDNLTMSQKQALMKIYVNNGVTNLDEIVNHYNRFSEGGSKETVESPNTVVYSRTPRESVGNVVNTRPVPSLITMTEVPKIGAGVNIPMSKAINDILIRRAASNNNTVINVDSINANRPVSYITKPRRINRFDEGGYKEPSDNTRVQMPRTDVEPIKIPDEELKWMGWRERTYSNGETYMEPPLATGALTPVYPEFELLMGLRDLITIPKKALQKSLYSINIQDAFNMPDFDWRGKKSFFEILFNRNPEVAKRKFIETFSQTDLDKSLLDDAKNIYKSSWYKRRLIDQGFSEKQAEEYIEQFVSNIDKSSLRSGITTPKAKGVTRTVTSNNGEYINDIILDNSLIYNPEELRKVATHEGLHASSSTGAELPFTNQVLKQNWDRSINPSYYDYMSIPDEQRVRLLKLADYVESHGGNYENVISNLKSNTFGLGKQQVDSDFGDLFGSFDLEDIITAAKNIKTIAPILGIGAGYELYNSTNATNKKKYGGKVNRFDGGGIKDAWNPKYWFAPKYEAGSLKEAITKAYDDGKKGDTIIYKGNAYKALLNDADESQYYKEKQWEENRSITPEQVVDTYIDKVMWTMENPNNTGYNTKDKKYYSYADVALAKNLGPGIAYTSNVGSTLDYDKGYTREELNEAIRPELISQMNEISEQLHNKYGEAADTMSLGNRIVLLDIAHNVRPKGKKKANMPVTGYPTLTNSMMTGNNRVAERNTNSGSSRRQNMRNSLLWVNDFDNFILQNQ